MEGIKMSEKLSVREQIIEKIINQGHDAFIACQEADRIIKEFNESDDKERTYVFTKPNGFAFTLKRKG
jgi:hypothetical protein